MSDNDNVQLNKMYYTLAEPTKFEIGNIATDSNKFTYSELERKLQERPDLV